VLGLFKKKPDPMEVLLGVSDYKYFSQCKDIFDQMDGPTRAHVLVAFQTVVSLVADMKDIARKSGTPWSTKDLIRDFGVAQRHARDEVNIRRQAWLMQAVMLYRMREIAEGNPQKIEVFGEVWCDIARAAPLLKLFLPDSSVWMRGEKARFYKVLRQDDEDVVIWAIQNGQADVTHTKAVRRLSYEYKDMIHTDAGLSRTA